MPVSGNEERGTIARQSSNFSAGVPIKKRRFPLARNASPPPAGNDSAQKEHPNSSEEPSLQNAFVANSPGLSDANKKSFSDEKKDGPSDADVNFVQNSIKLSTVKLEEPGVAIRSGSVDTIDSNEKFMLTQKSVCENSSKNTELQLKPNEPLAPNVGEEVLREHKPEGDCKLLLSTITENTELSLRPKELLIPALAGQISEGNCHVEDKLDPSRLRLFLGNEKNISRPESNNVKSSHLPANRSNWDLNTTMDAWEGSVGDATADPGNIGFSELRESGVDLGKQILNSSENRSKILVSSLNNNQLFRSDDSLRLRLSTPCPRSNFHGEQSGVSARQVSGGGFPGELVPSEEMGNVGRRAVKSEASDNNAKLNLVGAKCIPSGLSNLRTVKHELVERPCPEAVKLSTFSTQKIVEHRPVKSEPVQDINPEMQRTTEGILPRDGQVVQCQDIGSSLMVMPSTPQKLCPSLSPSYSTELSISASQSEVTTYTKEFSINTHFSEEACRNVDQDASETVSFSVACEGKTSIECDGIVDVARVEDKNVDDPQKCKLKSMDKPSLDSRGNGAGSVSDDEKINISADMVEEDSCSTDDESDGDHDVVVPMDREHRHRGGEDDEYEDGEVREPAHTAVEGLIGETELVNVNLDKKNVGSLGLLGDGAVSQSHAEENESKMEDCSKIDDDQIKECVDTVFTAKVDQSLDRDGSLQETRTLKVVVPEANEKRLIMATQTKLLDRSGPNGNEIEVSSDGAANASQVTVSDGVMKGNNTGVKIDSTLPRTEASLNGNDAAKDAKSGGNHSRIIKLPRASNVSYPCKTRFTPGRSFQSRTGRERDDDFEGDKFHPRGNRNENYFDGPRKFVRERNQDGSFRNSRMNFTRGRGRFSSHSGAIRGGWNPDRDFASEPYDGPSDFRFSRHKRVLDVTDSELDEMPPFRRASYRRGSPGSRDGPATRGIQMIRRFPRNISPNRCNSEDGTDLVRLRNDDKFIRGLPDDIRDSEFTHTQLPYERVDRRFVPRGNKNFSPVERRGLPRIRSKSPIRSPRRRTPDGFNGSPELTRRRSPPIYRIERMRSPDHPRFSADVVARRHDSPPYMSRPSNNRSLGRDLPRGTRRFDMSDPRERTDNDEYFEGPTNSGRFLEFGGDGSDNERRKFGERRGGHVRSFRPPFNGADDGNFRFQLEDGPGPLRFSRESDSEFRERSDLRKREFDRRMKNQVINGPRRTRSIEEQEVNYRRSGQVWQDDGFDDVSDVKRRRF